MARRGPRPGRFILNCEPSAGVDGDWTFEEAVAAGVVAALAERGWEHEQQARERAERAWQRAEQERRRAEQERQQERQARQQERQARQQAEARLAELEALLRERRGRDSDRRE